VQLGAASRSIIQRPLNSFVYFCREGRLAVHLPANHEIGLFLNAEH
jgi:hypothetical protein